MSEDLSEKAQKVTEEPKDEPEIVKQEVAAVREVVVQAIKEEFSGPIPPPDIIEKYERILPGAADRIITMAEQQATHRQAMEKKMIESESRDGLLGIIFAFFIRFWLFNCVCCSGLLGSQKCRGNFECIFRSDRNRFNYYWLYTERKTNKAEE